MSDYYTVPKVEAKRPTCPPPRIEQRGVDTSTFLLVCILIFVTAFIIGMELG